MSETEAVEIRRKAFKQKSLFESITEDDVEKYQEAFSIIDKNSSGRISLAEVGELLKGLGQQHPTEDDLQDIMEELDDENTGGISFPQFLRFMTRKTDDKDKAQELREAFAVMDTDGDGSISGEDLGKVLNKLGICVTEEEIQEMIKVADKTGEGKVNIDEFLSVMMG